MSQRRPGSSRLVFVWCLVWCLAAVAACASKGLVPTDGSTDGQGAAGTHAGTTGTTGAGGTGGSVADGSVAGTGSSAGGSDGLGGTGGGGVGGSSGGAGGVAGSGSAGSGVGVGGSGGGYPPGCHYDCFGGVSCFAGVATSYVFAPISCEAWTGSCAAGTHQCAEGCAIEVATVGSAPPFPARETLCAETANAKVGDPCSTFGGSLCLPTRATDGPDGGVVTSHLKCDPPTGKCVASLGPSPEQFGAPCYQPNVPVAPRTGYTSFQACPKQYCLRFDDVASGCTRSGCTSACWGDHQCPSGWFCDATLKNLSPSLTNSSPVCRPGPRAGVPKTLACVPP